jgi:tRNA-specific 2-thiouridylase
MSAAPHPLTIAVGMSGGVDSSVAAALLLEQGHRVFGIFMKNWDETDASGACTAEADYRDVEKVCQKLGIPYYSVEFVKEYRDQVFASFLEDYRRGYTPNPDILCNREIKFNLFLKHARALGADALATGHYCQKRWDPLQQKWQLEKGADPQKDQSYFVYTLTSPILESVHFPIGHLPKPEVRAIAQRLGLPTHAKKDSTGICFIGERPFRQFLSQYVAARPGPFAHLDGTKVGTHTGAAFYTLGQRRGLGLGGEGASWYVVDKDPTRNIVYVERGESHPALFARTCWVTETSWVEGQRPSLETLTAKIRYRQPDQRCTLTLQEGGVLRVDFEEPQRAITPGQAIVFYQGERCLGGGRIAARGATLWEETHGILPTGLTRLSDNYVRPPAAADRE